MRKAAMILAVLAGLCCVGIGIYLFVAQPAISKHWMQVWVWEMGIGRTFHIDGAATLFGSLALVYAAIMFVGAALMKKHFVAAGILLVALDMVACMVIAICPDPRMAVFVWAIPGLLLAGVGFLLGMELQRVQKPEGMAELE
jgi:hypothetical protein